MKRVFKPRLGRSLALAAIACLGLSSAAQAFCGFYVAKADGELFNEASKVVMMRDGRRTVITMANDYQGDAEDFAMVIPTPTVLKREQVNVAENSLIDHLDAYTAPRLVEYYDGDPCRKLMRMREALSSAVDDAAVPTTAARAKSLGVTIEAEYTVGEYDILILSAKQSDGLQTWLDENGYKTPPAAKKVLASYLARGMKFFVAKVNLEEKAKLGGTYLRPLQIAFESEKFMLPIRLGTVNAKGKQDLLLFTLTRSGRVEAANYRTANIPSNMDVPVYVQKKFGDFYKAMFATAVERTGGRTVLTEYAWDMNWCDPCAADPLSVSQLRQLGVFWLADGGDKPRPGVLPRRPSPNPARDVFVTRLHMRYDGETFPEDLRLMETGDRRNFQGRYVTRHPFVGKAECPAGKAYQRQLAEAYEKRAATLANLTGWDITEIRAAMAANGQKARPGAQGQGRGQGQGPDGPDWWKQIWKDR